MTTEPAPAPPGPDAEPSARAALDRSLVHGIAWTGAAKWAGQIVRWGSTLVIARLLTPDDYGLVGMAMVYLGFVQLVNEFGLTATIIQHRELTRRQISEIGGLAVAIGVGFCLLSIGMSPVLGAFFAEPALPPVIMVLSSTFLVRAFQVVPRGLLNRDLRFRQLAWIDGAEAMSTALVALLLALVGLDYWALVCGFVAAAVVATALAVWWAPVPLAWPRQFALIRPAVTFGGEVAIARVAWYVYSNADFAVVGRLLGRAALGAYTFGWTLANIPVERVSALVGRVTPAVFAAVQHDRAELRRYVLRLTEGLAIITIPASLGLALVAEEFVLVVLGETWRAAIAPLRLLCLYGGLRSVTTLLPQVLVATRQARRNMQISVLMAIVLPILFIIGARWGTTGVALAWVIGFPLLLIPFYGQVAFRAIDCTFADYGRALWPATSGCLVMVPAILGGRALLPPVPLAVRLAVLVAAGAAAYALVILLVHRDRVAAFRAMLAQLRRRK